MTARGSAFACLAAAAALSACGLLPAPEADRIPDAPPEPIRGGPQAIGPIVEIGRGQSLGIGWRYAAYESADGPCVILETGTGGGSSCGTVPDVVFQTVGVQSSTEGATVVDGMVPDEVASVVVRSRDGRAVGAKLMSLAPAGMEGQVFVAFVPADRELRSVVALDPAGDTIASQELPGP